MTSIPVGICRIYSNNFKLHYLKNKSLFLDLVLHFWNVHEVSIIFKKKDEYPILIISEIIDAERRGYLSV